MRNRTGPASFCCVVALSVLLGCSQSSIMESGPTGWEQTHWGMSSGELQRELGSVVHVLPAREDFGPTYYSDLIAEPYDICGEQFRIFFQMDSRSEQLTRIFAEVADTTAAHPKRLLVADVEALLVARHGDPDVVSTIDEGDVVSIHRRWLCDTYAVDLHYLYDALLESSDLFIAYAPRRKGDDDRS